MKFEVMLSAEPNYIKRSVVIRVMFFCFCTTPARFSDELTAPFVNLGVGATVHFLSLTCCQFMRLSPFPSSGRMAF
jgi:hypothetical protein